MRNVTPIYELVLLVEITPNLRFNIVDGAIKVSIRESYNTMHVPAR